MTYLKFNDTDVSSITSGLTVKYHHNYNAETNAAGDTRVDYINSKREIEVEFRPLNMTEMSNLQNLITFAVRLTYKDPVTTNLVSLMGIVDEKKCEYYTIQENKVLYKKAKITFKEL